MRLIDEHLVGIKCSSGFVRVINDHLVGTKDFSHRLISSSRRARPPRYEGTLIKLGTIPPKVAAEQFSSLVYMHHSWLIGDMRQCVIVVGPRIFTKFIGLGL